MTEWQDISTAPRDGTKLLAYWPDATFPDEHCVVTTWWGEIKGTWETHFHGQNEYDFPTHWMVQPPPPVWGIAPPERAKPNPGDDLSYYLGPSAKTASAEQCREVERIFAEAHGSVASPIRTNGEKP